LLVVIGIDTARNIIENVYSPVFGASTDFSKGVVESCKIPRC